MLILMFQQQRNYKGFIRLQDIELYAQEIVTVAGSI